jgi:hypothetical protein
MRRSLSRSRGGARGGRTAIDDPMTRALFARDFGVGPREFAALTRAEKKVYLEGLQQLNERENEQQGGRSRPRGQPRDSDRAMVESMEQELQNQSAS